MAETDPNVAALITTVLPVTAAPRTTSAARHAGIIALKTVFLIVAFLLAGVIAAVLG